MYQELRYLSAICHTEVATDEVREARRARVIRRCRARAGSPNGPADEEAAELAEPLMCDDCLGESDR